MWTLDEGLALIRELQPKVKKFNYHIALGGSVLNNGKSDKDLDLYFLNLDNGIDSENILAFLSSTFGILETFSNEEIEYEDNVWDCKYKANFNGKRIDFFIQ